MNKFKLLVLSSLLAGNITSQIWEPQDWPVLKQYDQQHLYQIALPLGGIGTGTVSLGGRGELRDWEIMNVPAKKYSTVTPGNNAPFFAIYTKSKEGKAETTLLAGLMNSLAKKGKEVGFIHFPTYLIDLKSSFSTGESEYAIERLMKVDYLLLDSIGEENVTSWSRDEILLTILSYRLLNQLPTFFTSMYGYNDLKKVYTTKKSDEIRANTITSKMKALSIEIMLDEMNLK